MAEDNTWSTQPSEAVSTTSDLYKRLMGGAAKTEIGQLQIGDYVPDFIAESTEGEVDFHASIDGRWGLFVTFHKNFDPVATTELAALSKLKSDLDERNVELIGLACNTRTSHLEWKRETEELFECTIDFPIVADTDAEIAKSFGLVYPDATIPVRGLVPASLTVLTAPSRRVQWFVYYPATTGRNFQEVIRVQQALQLSYDNDLLATGANYMAGEDVFVTPAISAAQAKSSFPKGFVQIKPWFRLTPPPETTTQDGAADQTSSGIKPMRDGKYQLAVSEASTLLAI
ncbi:hypothetical protein CTAYLR_002798 [Chrysophaeum taylorii]|uniref:Thioredoxin domain-containing protein n=1 Tax=Chrysophaeum taylorii TaxID=2483200 RepID=A0AAD7U819_9STRA|nr:hypothetical protein CTAYLR_002798 [Chrysophaeum taylorii]